MPEVKWTKEQLQAIEEQGSNILVAAAAGSGKTAVLVERIIHKIIDEKMDIDKMLVVTFTNAAASEMRERILDAIYKKLEQDPQNVHLQRQLTLLNKASICTIHSFCLDVIHNHFYEIDLPSNFRIADTAEIDLLKQDVLDDLFEQKYLENDSDFIELLETYTNYRGDEALQGLVLSIYRFIQSSPFPEEWLQEKLKMFTFSEMVEDFGETSFGKIILKYVKEELEESSLRLEKLRSQMLRFPELEKFTQVITEDKIAIEEIIQGISSWDATYLRLQNLNFRKWPVDKKVTIDLKQEAKEIRDAAKKKVKENICKLVGQNSQSIRKDFEVIYPILQKLVNLVLEFSSSFAKKKKEKNCIDFNDIEHFALQILLGEGNVQEQKEKNIVNPVAKKYQEKFVEIAVDEYQDSNLVQEAILTSISRGNNIFMVGDVKQSIYQFRQARPDLFLQKYHTYQLKEQKGEEDHLKIQLFRNFRSRQNILDITNFVFEVIMSKNLGSIDYNEQEYLNYGANYPAPEGNHTLAETTQILLIDLKQEESITAFQDENENKMQEDNLLEEEEEERVEDEVLEARMVAQKIQNLLQSDYQVYDKKMGYRQIQAKDIVILLRATSNLAPIYEKELTDLEIPVYSDTAGSYLDTVEIQTILSVLKILDNPLQEIPLVVVLRSMIGNFTDNDLIKIRLVDRNCNFYEALVKARLCTQGALKEKIEALFSKLDQWNKQKQYLALDELIWQIYIQTGYYQYVALLPNGGMRQANLKTLFEKAKQYESASYKGLFHFIHFIEKLKSQNGDLAPSKLIGENEDVVRIMSIHKSKGLEFPVVFLCNSQKRFNLKDLNESILLHQDMGFGPTLIDVKRRIKYPTLAKEAIKLQMKQETLSEEERILYVALTRAKEKLFITGRSKDLEKELNKKKQELELYLDDEESIKLDDKLIRKGKSYLDWLLYAYLLGKQKRIFLKGEEKQIDTIMSLSSYPKKELLENLHLQEQEEKQDVLGKLEEQLNSLSKQEKEKMEQDLQQILSWQYLYEVDTHLPTKTSVTNIKQELMKLADSQNSKEIMPKFMQKKSTITSAQKGTLMHLCIQKLEESKEYTLEDIKTLVEDLNLRQIITKEEKDAIDLEMLYRYTKSDLFQDLKKAKEIHKEQPFYISLPAKELIQEAKQASSEKNILVQGIIDLYYIDQNDHLVIVDFKTDYIVKENIEKEKEKIIQKYRVQLAIYQKALEQALGRKVDKVELCLANANWECQLVPIVTQITERK